MGCTRSLLGSVLISAGLLHCNLITGVGDLDVVDGEERLTARTDSGGDTGSNREAPDAASPIVLDAAAYDAGDTGYIDVGGAWSGSWNQDGTIFGGGFTMQLSQDGGSLSGSGEVKGGACPRMGTLTERFLSPNEITGTFTSDDGTSVLNLSFTISADGTSLKGRFLSVGACMPGVFGSTELTRSDLSSY